jgi:hypothetical protein
MIVIGTDTHKKTHTCGAVDAFTAAVRGELTVPARGGSFGKLLRWARALDPERVWAIEDCRHVSGALGGRPKSRLRADDRNGSVVKP